MYSQSGAGNYDVTFPDDSGEKSELPSLVGVCTDSGVHLKLKEKQSAGSGSNDRNIEISSESSGTGNLSTRNENSGDSILSDISGLDF